MANVPLTPSCSESLVPVAPTVALTVAPTVALTVAPQNRFSRLTKEVSAVNSFISFAFLVVHEGHGGLEGHEGHGGLEGRVGQPLLFAFFFPKWKSVFLFFGYSFRLSNENYFFLNSLKSKLILFYRFREKEITDIEWNIKKSEVWGPKETRIRGKSIINHQ